MASMGPANTKQPTECYLYRDFIPSIPNAPKYYVEVPLAQTGNPYDDMTVLLQGCCHSKVSLYSNPNPCTAVCTSISEKLAIDVTYCLNSKNIAYGGVVKDSGVGSLVSGSVNTWSLLLIGGLVIWEMML